MLNRLRQHLFLSFFGDPLGLEPSCFGISHEGLGFPIPTPLESEVAFQQDTYPGHIKNKYESMNAQPLVKLNLSRLCVSGAFRLVRASLSTRAAWGQYLRSHPPLLWTPGD
jgi:hypothetical protein